MFPVGSRDGRIYEDSGVMFLFLKNLAFTLVVPGTVAVYLPWVIARGKPIGSLGAALPAVVLLIIGGAMYLWCLWDFATFGRGTPAPIDAPKRLVVRGLYRYTRNPMYVAVLTFILGWGVLFELLSLVLYALAVGVVVHLFVLFYEEPHLRRVFGLDYEEYCSRVGRWLPKISSRSAPAMHAQGENDTKPVDAADQLEAGRRPPANGR